MSRTRVKGSTWKAGENPHTHSATEINGLETRLAEIDQTTETLEKELKTKSDIHSHPYLGKTATAEKAKKLAEPCRVLLSGDLSGSVSFDGSANVILTAYVKNNSHYHSQLNETELYSINVKDHNNGTWLRNTEGLWYFQSGVGNDYYSHAASIYVPPVTDSTAGNSQYIEIGSRSSNNGKPNKFKGVRIVRNDGKNVVKGDISARTHYVENTVIVAAAGNDEKRILNVGTANSGIMRYNGQNSLAFHSDSSCMLFAGDLPNKVVKGLGHHNVSSSPSETAIVAADGDVLLLAGQQDGYNADRKAVLKTNGDFEVKGLRIGGKTTAELFLGKTAKAADADKLDGKDSSAFALKSPDGGLNIAGRPLYSARGEPNWDYIYHNDSTNSWQFCSDVPEGTANAEGNSILGCSGLSKGTTKALFDGYMFKLSSTNGYARIGANNKDYFHFYTDRDRFYFDKSLNVKGEIYAGSDYKKRVYHQGFKPTAADTGAYSKSQADSRFLRSDADDNITGNLEFQDNKTLAFGNSSDFKIWHDGSNHYFRSYKHGAAFYIQGENASGSNKTCFQADPDNHTRLYYAGSEKIRTESYGAYVVGTLKASTDVVITSDARVKTNIKPIPNALDKVDQLSGNTYDRTDIEAHQAGLIAQELQAVLPEGVSEDENGQLSVKPVAAIALLVEAVKELNAEVKELRAAL